jgi:hypothetical protein
MMPIMPARSTCKNTQHLNLIVGQQARLGKVPGATAAHAAKVSRGAHNQMADHEPIAPADRPLTQRLRTKAVQLTSGHTYQRYNKRGVYK